MKQVLAIILVSIGFVTPVLAHPGVGIVQDRRGNIYFTDLKQSGRSLRKGSKRWPCPRFTPTNCCLTLTTTFLVSIWYTRAPLGNGITEFGDELPTGAE